MDATTTFMKFHRAGKIRVLAVSGSRRAASLPDVPTFAESGFPDLVGTSGYVVYARADTPPAAIAQWNQALRKVLAQEDVRAKHAACGV